MKYIGLLSSAASGKLGGVVASHNRNGSYLRHHVVPVQPRTASQTANRSQLAAFSSAYKSLTSEQISGWNALGDTVTLKSKLGTTYHPTGQQLFVSCNRHLAELGIPTLLSVAPSIPSIPGITSLTVTATLTGGVVTGFPATLGSTPGSQWGIVIRGTSVQTTGRTFVGKSLFRTLAGYGPATSNVNGVVGGYVAVPTDYFNIYQGQFGPLPATGNVTFELKVVDPVSGFAGPQIRATLQFIQTETGALFSLTGTPSITLSSGTPAAVALTGVTYAAILPFAGSVNWNFKNLPGGITPIITPNPHAGYPATVTLTPSNGQTEGTFTSQLVASFGSFNVSLPITIHVGA
jgi:hypothetical protein